MATTLTVEEHLAVLRAASAQLVRDLHDVAETTSVPTCSAWDARALLAHIVMVHDWATSHIQGDGGASGRSQTQLRASDDDLFPLFEAGTERLVSALREARDDLDTKVFLRNAPRPRAFWARRQAHETTVHAVDALATRLGRLPRSTETGISTEVALDGIDELLMGFIPRGRSHWNNVEPFTLAVHPTDSNRGWLLRIDSEHIRATEDADPSPDVVFTGTAVALYLGLWNRGDEITQSGPLSVLETWRAVQRVQWS